MLFEFRLYPTKQKQYVRQDHCKDRQQAKELATGMMYAMFFEHKHPRLEIYQDGKRIHTMS